MFPKTNCEYVDKFIKFSESVVPKIALSGNWFLVNCSVGWIGGGLGLRWGCQGLERVENGSSIDRREGNPGHSAYAPYLEKGCSNKPGWMEALDQRLLIYSLRLLWKKKHTHTQLYDMQSTNFSVSNLVNKTKCTLSTVDLTSH